MARKRKSETAEQRDERLKKKAKDRQNAGDRAEDAVDARVRQSIKLHGA